MAQILKEELKNAIVNSAKKEFLENGYENASMRKIAKQANMTVGNLYRYFDSKRAIHEYICGDTLQKIDYVLRKMTHNQVSLVTRVFNVVPDTAQLKNILNEVGNSLVDIYEEHKIEFNILMLHSELEEDILNWFAKVVYSIINSNFSISLTSEEVMLLANAYSSAIFEGLSQIFKNADNTNSDVLKIIIHAYFGSYIEMLDTDIRKFIG